MITTAWGNPEKTIVTCTFIDPWTWDEYYAMLDEAALLFNSIDHLADYLLDFSQGHKMPGGAMTHLRQVASHEKPRRGLLVMVDLGPLAQGVVNLLLRVYPKMAYKIRQANTLEEAYAILHGVRQERQQIH
ncbi:MAG TPA: hypothetical protein VHO69_16500 [Phototrophicaceae bacterium]|nr:hypothetical protein [Phototrophicaceae bacterium]